MRLLSIELTGFRGFATHQTFDLDADAVIVVGANGNGKTSLFDAILWALSGRIPRLGTEDWQLVCRFSETGEARVVLRLTSADRTMPITVTRIVSGKETRVSVETSDGVLRGPEAEGRLIQSVWKEAATAADPKDALAIVLTRSVYLQQDLVRQFIESATEQERFAAVSELVGAGRVTELQAELEKAKAAWTKATNYRATELQPLRSRVASMESRRAELKARPVTAGTGLDEASWNKWWRQLQELGLRVSLIPMSSREAASSIDAVIKQLDALRLAAERRQQLLESLGRDLGGIAGRVKPDLVGLRERAAIAKQRVQDIRAKVAEEQARVADVRRMQADLQEKSEQLKALAALALKQLGKKCPVCEQDYDRDGTRGRLESIASGGSTAPTVSPLPEKLPELLASLAAQEKTLSATELDLRTAEQAAREYEITELAIDKRFAELGLTPQSASERASALRDATASVAKQVVALSTAQRAGEAFALLLSQTGDQAAVQELEREIAAAKGKLKADDTELAQRSATGEQAQHIIEALREAASSVVTERVKEIEPLLADMYSRIDAHPAFRVVKLLASVVRGRGQLATVVSDPLSEVQCDAPRMVLSSSQMNALAVCTFLSLNLGVSRPPLMAAILDDPLQSLDDINLLGLIDLLRRTKDQRQLCVSTHDVRFGNLLARKLRPKTSDQRTVVIELDGWSRMGPVVTTRDVKSDPTPMRLIA